MSYHIVIFGEISKESHTSENHLNNRVPIKYLQTAYVQVTPDMLDAIKNEIHGWADGEENVCVTCDEMKQRLATGDINDPLAVEYLNTVDNQLIQPVGDIVFHI